MNDPWANRHPEWAQDEAETHRAADRARARRLALGLILFGLVAVATFVAAFRDQLPAGW